MPEFAFVTTVIAKIEFYIHILSLDFIVLQDLFGDIFKESCNDMNLLT